MSVEPSPISQEEQEQIRQTIEMFEVITQANPNDCQSLEILKDAYQRIGQLPEMLKVARQLAETYVQLGQFSSAMLEYEGILQRTPDDPRSEEHTSELQSPDHLVCRLLLEKKKKQRTPDRRRNPTRRNSGHSSTKSVGLIAPMHDVRERGAFRTTHSHFLLPMSTHR